MKWDEKEEVMCILLINILPHRSRSEFVCTIPDLWYADRMEGQPNAHAALLQVNVFQLDTNKI